MKTLQNEPLAKYTSLSVGGPAQTLIQLDADDNLAQVLADCSQPVTVVGYGANSLISDSGLPGTVIVNHSGSIQELGNQRLKVAAGVNWDQLIQKTVELGLFGLEFTSGIPGGVGAAVVGNIAAYGQKVSDCLVEATVVQNGKTEVWPASQFELGYRSSCLPKDGVVILDATFQLSQQATSQLEYRSALKISEELGVLADTLENRRQIILETRRRAGALLADNAAGPWTAGSFFKNPVVSDQQLEQLLKMDEFGTNPAQAAQQNQLLSGDRNRVSAAHVLLAAGYKRGQSWGPVRLHPDHILKIENTGGATASQIYAVCQEIIKTVQDKLGISLQPEVRFLGQF